jgi:signal transduction histidine kinase
MRYKRLRPLDASSPRARPGMTVAAAFACMAAALAVYVAVLARRFSAAPGWQDQRWFGAAALSVAFYAALDVPVTIGSSDAAVLACSRIQVLVAAFHVVAWMRYSDIHLRRAPARWERWFARALLAASATALVPALVYPADSVRTHPFAPLGLVYKDAIPTAWGQLLLTAVLAVFVLVTVRYARAWRRGVPDAALHCAALCVLLAMSTNDVLVASRVLDLPYLVDVGFVVPICAVGYSLTARFAADARDLARLRLDLEAVVAERTRELSRTQDALHRSEKLASLGQFAAGVAHEVNNPAAVVTANLRYVLDVVDAEGEFPADARDCVSDSLVATDRIARIVRQLLDASRLAAAPLPTESLPVAGSVAEGIRTAQARCGGRVRFESTVGADVRVLAQENVLVQVLVNLLVNAAQAVPEPRTDGRVKIRAEREDGKVRIHVEDNGAGMTGDVLRRVFEPFFTTKPLGSGTGLGLAVSRGLLVSLGGDLRLASRPGAGTCATIELPEGSAVTVAALAPHPAPARVRFRILVVDDDPAVLASLRRLLSTHYAVEVAGSVDEGLASLGRERFDVVVCDLMMPAGGGERLYRDLARADPDQAARLVFLTGGASSEAARHFLAGQPQPVLEKPLELAALAAAAELVTSRATGCA